MIAEIWKEHSCFTNYEISTYGRVRNKKTLHILKPLPKGNGYTYVQLRGTEHPKNVSIHVLVLETHGPKRPSIKHEVNHKDTIRDNNVIGNLEWLTRQENILLSLSGRRGFTTDSIVLQIRKDYAEGLSIAQLATKYNMKYARIHCIVTQRTWRHI